MCDPPESLVPATCRVRSTSVSAVQFASWAGCLIQLTSPIVLVAESEEKVAEAQTRLARVGLENVKGYLAGGIYAWNQAGLEVDAVPQISVIELKDLIDKIVSCNLSTCAGRLNIKAVTHRGRSRRRSRNCARIYGATILIPPNRLQ